MNRDQITAHERHPKLRVCRTPKVTLIYPVSVFTFPLEAKFLFFSRGMKQSPLAAELSQRTTMVGRYFSMGEEKIQRSPKERFRVTVSGGDTRRSKAALRLR